MRKRLNLTYLLLINLIQACMGHAQNQLKIGNTTVLVDTVISGIDIPWEIIWGPDHYIWMTERKGIVSRVNPSSGLKTVILDLSSSVFQQSEAGLLGLALHPDFPETPEVFLVYTYRIASSTKERLVKYIYSSNALIHPDTLIDNIIGNTTHDGSRLLFLPDNTLLMTTGDAQNQSSPQDLDMLNGKVLRLNTDGTIPADNPFPGSYVYSFGHRNAQGLIRLPNGRIYVSEHGPDSDDEFQELLIGRNYGWPNVKGFCNESAEMTFCANNNVVEPLLAWTPTIAPSDMAYYTNPAFPEFDSCILLTILKDKKLVALKMSSDGSMVKSQTHYLTNAFGRLRDICIGPDGEIYLATNGANWNNSAPNTHSIIRLTPQDKTSAGHPLTRNHMRIYPNPVNGLLHIDLQNVIPDGMSLQLIDPQGHICKQENPDTSIVQWPLSDLAKGVYILQMVLDGRIMSWAKVINQ
jgi:aldose sugar dehydrogenase